MQILNFPVFSAQANATANSAPILCRFLASASCQITFTDVAAAGTLKLQVSNDPVNPTNWNDLANSSVTVAAGATSVTPPLTPYLAYQYIRAVWTRTAGAGTMTAQFHAWGFAD